MTHGGRDSAWRVLLTLGVTTGAVGWAAGWRATPGADAKRRPPPTWRPC